jgi:hypothetical protein
MKLIRRIEIVPEILVFYCAPCKHAETKVQEPARLEAEERAAPTCPTPIRALLS